MIEIEEIMDESETYVKRKKMSDKLKKYLTEKIFPQFEAHYDVCEDASRGIYYMFCNTTKQPGVFSFAICNVGVEYGNIKNVEKMQAGSQMFLLLNDENLGELNDSQEIRREFTDFLNKYFVDYTNFTGTSVYEKLATQTEIDEGSAPYISGYLRK